MEFINPPEKTPQNVNVERADYSPVGSAVVPIQRPGQKHFEFP